MIIPIIIIVLISIITHGVWFFNSSILSSGDWGFFFNETQKQLIYLNYIWRDYGDLGNIFLYMSMVVPRGVWQFLSSFNFAIDERILYVWPSALLVGIGSFLLAYRITKSKIGSFVGSLAYSYNTYFLSLSVSGELTIAMVYVLAPFILWLTIKSLEEKKFYLVVFNGILCFIASSYEFRIFYILSAIIFLYTIYCIIISKNISLKIIFKTISLGLAPIIIALTLNLYWILPLVSTNTLLNNYIFSRDLFGDEFYNLLYAFTLFHPFWTGAEPSLFKVMPLPTYVWLIPFFAFLGLFLNRKNKLVLFFGLISLIGVFLTKQVAIPFGNVYPILYKYLPGFGAFREASKFYFLIALGYGVLIGSLVGWLCINLNNKKGKIFIKYLLITLISFIFLWNTKPLLTGEFHRLMSPREVPQDYVILKDFLLKQPEYSKTLWIPAPSRWSFYSLSHPEVNYVESLEDKDRWSFLYKCTSKTNKNPCTEGDVMLDVLETNVAHNLFDISSMRYVILPFDELQRNDYFFSYGRNRASFIKELNTLNYLSKINIGTKTLLVYENKQYKPHIYTTQEKETIHKDVPFENVKFQFINPTEYTVSLKNISKPIYINFSESYNSDWKIHIGNFNLIETLINRNYFLPDKYHFRNDATLSSYYLDPNYIKNNFSKDSYHENPDGSIDVNLMLYFMPQTYMYLGLSISGLSIIGFIGYLSFLFIKKIKYAKK